MTQGTLTLSRTGVEKSLSVGRKEIPDWVAKDLDCSPTAIAQLEVTDTAHQLYSALTKYFAQRAVDIDQVPPKSSERIHGDPFKDEREYPGKLTSIQNPPSTFAEAWRYFYYNDDDSDSESDDESEQNSNMTYTAGYGWGKVRTNPNSNATLGTGDQVAIFHHYARGEPTFQGMMLGVYQVLVLYAPSDTILKALCRDALAWHSEREKLVHTAAVGRYVLYTLKVSDCEPPKWVCHGQRPSRPVSSIVLAPGIQEDLMNDARTFFNKKTKNWYHTHGIPYRRNYLLYGAPGTGKTSSIRALAGDQKLKACFLSLSHKNLGDHTLIEALSKIPKPCVIVFEDIDALFDSRYNVSASSLTFSGLLNAVDGMVSTEGTLIMMTTNHKDRLDDALLRCGRIDRQFEFKLPGHPEIARYYSSYYPDASPELAKRFADAVCARKESKARSLATLQQHFIFTRGESAETAVEKIDEFFKTHFPEKSTSDESKEKKVGVLVAILGAIPIVGRFFHRK